MHGVVGGRGRKVGKTDEMVAWSREKKGVTLPWEKEAQTIERLGTWD